MLTGVKHLGVKSIWNNKLTQILTSNYGEQKLVYIVTHKIYSQIYKGCPKRNSTIFMTFQRVTFTVDIPFILIFCNPVLK